MTVSKDDLYKLAKLSFDGEFNRYSIDQFCKTYPELTEEEAYAGQSIRVQLMEEKGHRVIGYKLGGTSLAKLNQIQTELVTGVKVKKSHPSYGRLMNYMLLKPEEDLKISELLHPKIEAELAFIIKDELYGNNVTAVQVMNSTEFVAPAFEIIDSRFHDFKIGSSYDALIDNTSSARFKLGTGRKSPYDIDLALFGVRVCINGEYTGFGAGASVLGHPARAVASLVNSLYLEGKGLRPGDIVLSGAITTSTPIKLGDKVRADFESLGSIRLEVV